MSNYEKHRISQLRSLLSWRKAVLNQELHTRNFEDIPSVAHGIREEIKAIDTILENLPQVAANSRPPRAARKSR